MKKKLLSLVMAVAMTLSLAAPAFATGYFSTATASTTVTPPEITFAATTFVPTISLGMPTPGANPVVLNPYKISFTGTNKINSQSVNAADASEQVICPVYYIENKTNAVLKYAVSAKTTVQGLELLDSNVGIKATDKQAFLVLVFSKTEMAKDAVWNTTGQQVSGGAQLDRFDESKYETIILAEGEEGVSSKEEFEKTLAPGDVTPNYLPFQFQGNMSRNPESAWTNSDTVNVVVKFTFNPDSAQDFVLQGNPSATGTGADKITYVETNAVTDSTTTGLSYTLPGGQNAPTSGPFSGTPKYFIGASTTEATSPVPTFSSTDPAWELLSGGQNFGAAVNNGALTFDADSLKALKAGNHTTKVVLSYNDANEIPRTLGVKLKITRS